MRRTEAKAFFGECRFGVALANSWLYLTASVALPLRVVRQEAAPRTWLT